ncbi:hypothetical protein LZG04_06590 [Saccharothrix sp. S26]|uniref:hypothetical protein n=1 Tax=Saccharothrix sp. S26 TaxID=2907215 RepID=UPI001F42D79D|nr:hypothetical protein [Saccharothrix sp. S26]MCE6994476.1 hypothetical protein [Saccharothrix sp. S26]
MLKKAGTLAAVVAGLMLVGAPAFAVTGEPHEDGRGPSYDDGHYTAIGQLHNQQYVEDGSGDTTIADQFGLLNLGNDSDAANQLSICEVEVNAVLGIPVLSNNDENLCLTSDNDDNDSADAGDNSSES